MFHLYSLIRDYRGTRNVFVCYMKYLTKITICHIMYVILLIYVRNRRFERVLRFFDMILIMKRFIRTNIANAVTIAYHRNIIIFFLYIFSICTRKTSQRNGVI